MISIAFATEQLSNQVDDKVSAKLFFTSAASILMEYDLLTYFSSWIMQIHFLNSHWRMSLIGIGMVGQQSFIDIPQVQTFYIILFLIFVIVHSDHSYLAFKNI